MPSLATSATPIDWKHVPHFDYALQRIHLTTDGSWTNAHVANTGPFKSSDGRYIWAAQCVGGEQRVTFSKTISAPGAPLEGQARLTYGPGNQLYGGRPYKSAELLVNGATIAQLGNINANPRAVAPEVSGAISKTDLGEFRYGTNTITVHAVKAALKQGERCVDPKKPRYVSVFASLDLQFGSDLRVSLPRKPRVVERNVMNGQNVAASGVINLLNDGPSASLEGYVLFQVIGPGIAAISPETRVSEPLDCKVPPGGLVGAQLKCPYEDLRKGERARIDYVVGVHADYSSFRNGSGKMQITADFLSKAPDPKLKNNRQEAVVILCAPGATDRACR